ncbi:MAG: hypothetical protein H0W39_09885 [Sphingomonas sp.]|nr:hypothetical protein [Sphingomonas sp.]
MSRIDRKIEGAVEAAVDAAEILAALGKEPKADADSRKFAVSRYLSATDGWEEASTMLAGAFADEGAGLRGDKDQ